ncbi:helix-turn-helix domain-containing protein [Zobellella sp. DQSA1]|uniref:helix-turn-helix domain-containing protein n=1 Tax=Zobellella sp. DQSA1 TaxID=3342386 RepID=UPI0035BEEC65
MDLIENLKLLCGHYDSMAQVCRKMGINRTQFNKYLNGKVTPSKANLRMICDFFGVEEFEILMPHEQFTKQVIAARAESNTHAYPDGYFKKVAELRSQSRVGLERYLGWYHEYYYSLGYPGRIFRSLIEVSTTKQGIAYARYERLIGAAARGEKVTHCRYHGIAVNLCDRIFLMDYEALTENEITQTVLFPSYKSQLKHLLGVKIGVSSKSHRTPACTRVLYDYLGETVDFKKQFRVCGLYEEAEIDGRIRAAIDNRRGVDEPLFLAIGE